MRIVAALLFAVACAGLVRADAVLFDGVRQQGSKLTLQSGLSNLDRSNFRNRAESLIVSGTPWQICTDPDFKGQCQIMPPGRYDSLGGFANNIASLRPAEAEKPAPKPARPAAPKPSSCKAATVESCDGCSVTCNDGMRAACKPGTPYPKLSPQHPAQCAWQAECACK